MMNSDEFRRIRQHLGLTQQDFGKYLGVAQPAISRIESGRRQPTTQHAAAVRMLLDLLECREALGMARELLKNGEE